MQTVFTKVSTISCYYLLGQGFKVSTIMVAKAKPVKSESAVYTLVSGENQLFYGQEKNERAKKEQVFNRLTADVVKVAQFLNQERKKLSLDYKSE